MANRQQAP